MSAIEAGRKVGVGFIGTGAVTAYHHLPGLRLDPRAELVAICDTDPEILKKRQAEWSVAHASTDPEVVCGLEEVDAVVIATPNDTHRPIAAGRGQGRQTRHVREAAGIERGGSGRDVHGGARRGRRAHDSVHLSFCAVDALSRGIFSSRGRWERRGIFDRSDFWIGPRRAGAGGNTRREPARATSST